MSTANPASSCLEWTDIGRALRALLPLPSERPEPLTPQEFIDATENFIQWCSPSLDMLLWVAIRRSNGAAVAMEQPVCCYELAAGKDQLP